MNMIIFDVLSVIVPIFILGMFVFTIIIMLSPKLRGKLMSRQIKATKYMMEDAKDDLNEIGTIAGDIQAQTRKNILDQNEEVLREVEKRSANIEKEGIKIKMRAMKDGFSKNTVYCKHCGASIDEDSKFCKYCGKEQ